MKFKALSLLFPMDKAIHEAKEFADDCWLRHDVPHGPNVPADLADKEGTGQLNSKGYPVAGMLLVESSASGTASPALPLYIGLYALVAVLVGLLPQLGLGAVAPAILLAYFIGFYCFFGGLKTVLFALATVGASTVIPMLGGPLAAIGMKTSFVQDIFNLIPAFAPLVYLEFTNWKIASKLARQGTENAGASFRAPKSRPNEERHIQAFNANEDISPLVDHGTSTGTLTSNGDSYAPDRGLPVVQSQDDLGTHLHIFGSTGTGKTALLRKILKGLKKSSSTRNGIFIMDGKGYLARDCAKYLDFIIDEKVKNLNLLEGFTPEQFADMLKTLNSPAGGESGNSKFFSDTGRNLVFIGSVFHEAIVEQNLGLYNLTTRFQVVTQLAEKAPEGEQHPLTALIKNHPEFGVEGTLLTDAVLSFAALQENDGETLKNVMATVNAWFAPFFQNKLLRHFADSTTSDIDIVNVLKGASIGICFPEALFPTAGVMFSKFLKAKLYRAIQARGDNWKEVGGSQVFFIADEVQRLIDSSDLAMLPIARSLGLSCIFATQNVDSYFAEFPKDKALAMLDSFGSIISYKSSAPTYDYVKDRIGKDRVWVEQIQAGMISYSLTNRIIMASPMNDPNNRHRRWMKILSMNAFSKLFRNDGIEGLGKNGSGQYATLKLSEQPIHILQEKDVQLVNTKKFYAIADLARGGARRRDIIVTNPLNSNFEPIDTSYADKLRAKARIGGVK